MATKMKMVMKDGKKVPAFAADGKGKMQMGGIKKYQLGGPTTDNKSKLPKEEIQGMKSRIKDLKNLNNDLGYTPVKKAIENIKTGSLGRKVIREAKKKYSASTNKQYGGAKPKAMYGTSMMKPTMMKKGGAKKIKL